MGVIAELPRPIRAVVFDLDGLILDTERAYFRAAVAAGEVMGVRLTSEIYRQMIGNGWPAISALLRGEFGADFHVDYFREVWVRPFHVEPPWIVPMKVGVTELLDHLDVLGLPRAIASSSNRRDAEMHLARHDLGRRFDAIILEGDFVCSKPAPDPYLAAAHALNLLPEQCLALEDSYNGIRSAAGAGMITVMIPDLIPPTQEIRNLCHYVADNLLEIIDILP